MPIQHAYSRYQVSGQTQHYTNDMTLDKPKCKLAYKPGFVCSTFLLPPVPHPFSLSLSFLCGALCALCFSLSASCFFVFVFFLLDRSLHLVCMWQAFLCLSHSMTERTVRDMCLETLELQLEMPLPLESSSNYQELLTRLAIEAFLVVKP